MDEQNQFDISNLPNLSQLRILENVTSENGVRIFLQSGIEPQLQNGPRCGLVALSISLKYFGVDISVEQLLEKAIDLNYTKQGEMFSAANLSSLANIFLKSSSSVIPFLSSSQFVDLLCSNYQFLIPYDCDKNFNACSKNGKKAHWLLVCGFIYRDASVRGIWKISCKDVLNLEESSLFLLGYQGKSRSIGLFRYSDLIQSNSQLFEAGEDRNSDDFLIENSKDLSELRGKIIKISKK